MKQTVDHLARSLFVLATLFGLTTAGAVAEGLTIPNYWDTAQRIEKPERVPFKAIRFLTSADYPPFNFSDKDGRLIGFNIDLARAICKEVALPCTIQAWPWNKLEKALADGRGDAIIAGLAARKQVYEKADMSRTYLTFPARFVMHKERADAGEVIGSGKGQTIGVLAKSAHAAYLKRYFPDASIKPFDKPKALYAALADKSLHAAFGDGMTLSFWLQSREAVCCTFTKTLYHESRYFGPGMAIAVKRGNRPLRAMLDYALQRLYEKGQYRELFLRYFPISFF